MKTALLSVHSDPNYGSMLQAYALSAALNKLGCENEYINYLPYNKQNPIVALGKKIIKKTLELLHLRNVRKTEYSYWSSKEFSRQLQLFNKFHDKHILSSKKLYYRNTISHVNALYNRFVIGSDQTWNPLVSAFPFSISFLHFVTDSSKKCAYAPSIGTTNISEEYLQKLKESLSDFSYLSCREKANADTLTSYIGKKVEHVLDPTLLLDKEEWMHLSEPIEMPPKYILCYILGTKKNIYDYAANLAKENNIPLYIIATRPEYLHYSNALVGVSVGQFISLIESASYVVTDSFHGSLFSINLGTNFYVFTKREQNKGMNDNDRIGDFLNVVGLLNRLKDDDEATFEKDIDFNAIYDVLEPLRASSFSYLKQII